MAGRNELGVARHFAIKPSKEVIPETRQSGEGLCHVLEYPTFPSCRRYRYSGRILSFPAFFGFCQGATQRSMLRAGNFVFHSQDRASGSSSTVAFKIDVSFWPTVLVALPLFFVALRKMVAFLCRVAEAKTRRNLILIYNQKLSGDLGSRLSTEHFSAPVTSNNSVPRFFASMHH